MHWYSGFVVDICCVLFDFLTACAVGASLPGLPPQPSQRPWIVLCDNVTVTCVLLVFNG